MVTGFTSVHAVTLQDQFKRIHDRIAGTHPDAAALSAMQSACTAADPSVIPVDSATWSTSCMNAAAFIALDNPRFYNVTLKNMVSPWTNEAQSVYEPLNDYTATVIGIVRDDLDFRKILTDDILYTIGNPDNTPPFSLPAYSKSNNAHYEDAEAQDIDLKANLFQTIQSKQNTLGIPSSAAAGVLTTRAAAKAFYIDGTNRAMFRFTILNHFCNDLEYYKDGTRASDRIRQDVSRSPGGDSRIYLNNCIGCHAGMDGLAGAFAYYNYEYDPDADPNGDNGVLAYKQNFDPEPFTDDEHKYLINADNFKWGYRTVDDSWVNYWRNGPNINIGWDTSLPGSGNGAASLGQELANTNEFASCQVKKVFKTVCLRSPVDQVDRAQISTMTATFKTGYNLKQAFADAASYCMVPTTP